jgi:hypothetical protein
MESEVGERISGEFWIKIIFIHSLVNLGRKLYMHGSWIMGYKREGAGGVAQAVRVLPSKYKAMSSSPSTAKK